WTGEAAIKNPAYRSPIETSPARKQAILPRKIISFVTLLLLFVFGAGAATLAVAQNTESRLNTIPALSTLASTHLSTSEATDPELMISTQIENWEKGSFPYLYQKDPQWAYYPYASSNLGSSGQVPFCLAMANVYLTGSQEMQPQTIATLLEKAGFTANSSSDRAGISGCAGVLGLKTNTVALNQTNIRKELIAGKPIICVMGLGDFTKTRTYILLTGVNMDSKLIIRDPLSESRSTEAWDFKTIIAQTESMTALSPATPSA
ncbi:MAG: papain-like cysteine protease family protein, partial [Raoultibacter sp.]